MRKIKQALALACLILLGLAGLAYAADIPGQVSVIAPGPHLDNIVIPGSVDPGIEFVLEFQALHSLTMYPMYDIEIHLWSNEVAKTDPYNALNHYYLRFHKPSPWVWDTLSPSADYYTELHPTEGEEPEGFDTLLEYTFLLTMYLDESAYGGLWNWEIKFEDTASMTGNPENVITTENGTFDVTPLISISLGESSFDFGSVEQGVALVPIQSGAGYLTFTVSSNVAWLIQISGTDPDDGASHSFTVDNILQNSVDNDLTAVALTNALAGLAGYTTQPRGSGGNSVYLWISIPEGQPIALYTMMLTIVVVAA